MKTQIETLLFLAEQQLAQELKTLKNSSSTIQRLKERIKTLKEILLLCE